jgi:hypothetical protein
MADDTTPEHPAYRKVPHPKTGATQRWFIVCNEGWREFIVCERMYEDAADWLVGILQGRPYAPKVMSDQPPTTPVEPGTRSTAPG